MLNNKLPRYKLGTYFHNFVECLSTNKEGISILFSSIYKDRHASNPRVSNPDNLKKFIKSIIDTTSEEERSRLEIIIKFDIQDDLDFIKNNFGQHVIYFNNYGDMVKLYKGIAIRCIVYDKSEGRASIHDFLSYLGSIAHPDSVLYFNVADDFIFVRKNWVTDLLNVYNKSKKEKNGFCIIGPCSTKQTKYTEQLKDEDKLYYYDEERDGEFFPWDDKMTPIDKWSTFPDVSLEMLDNIASNTITVHNSALHKYIGEYCPVFSKKVYDIISGNFWMPSIDAYFTFLGAILAKKFNMSITTRIENFYVRDNLTIEPPPIGGPSNTGLAPVPDYNYNTFSGGQQVIRNCQRFFSLISQQALNIKLNSSNE